VKRFDEPDEVVSAPLVESRIVMLGDVYVARIVHQPGWSWAEHVKPIVGTPSCLHHHQGVLLSGEVGFEMDDGAHRRVRAGEAYDVPPSHNGWVIGDEPAVVIEFTGVRGWAKPPEGGERVLATIVFTDIVDSTATASRIGDARWKELLAQHGDRVRLELDRCRGTEVGTTGDGFMTVFDSPSRAVRWAAAVTAAAEHDGLQIRAGVHSGEVERQGNNFRGVAVHAAARIAALAGPGEVLVSSAAASLVEGAGLRLEEAGEHELKGLPGSRLVYRLLD
jgi:class 3 adenylate cyclase